MAPLQLHGGGGGGGERGRKKKKLDRSKEITCSLGKFREMKSCGEMACSSLSGCQRVGTQLTSQTEPSFSDRSLSARFLGKMGHDTFTLLETARNSGAYAQHGPLLGCRAWQWLGSNTIIAHQFNGFPPSSTALSWVHLVPRGAVRQTLLPVTRATNKITSK